MRATATALALAALLAGCGDKQPAAKTDTAPAACVEALRQQYADARAADATGYRPPECANVSDKGLEAAVAEVLAG